MKLFTRIFTLALCLFAARAWAAVPFVPTTLQNGQFAEGTTWYSLQIGASGLRISDNGTAASIQLGGTLNADPENQWCFVGNDEEGYLILNKQAGPGKALAAPVKMSDGEGKTSYAVLKDLNIASTDVNRWDFKEAKTASGGAGLSVENAWYVSQHGYGSNILNNREGKLAFWSKGYDDGSAIQVKFLAKSFTVSLATGSFTATNAAGNFASKWESTATAPRLVLSCGGVNNMCAAADKANINFYSGKSESSSYTLTAGTGFSVAGFSFKMKHAATSSASVKVTADGKEYTVTNSETAVSVEGKKDPTVQFTVSGANSPVTLTEFRVEVTAQMREVEPQFNVFESRGLPTNRIPAIAKASNGDILAVADLRYNGSDIGFGGRLDLRGRISKDNGKNWGEIFTIVNGNEYTDKNTLMNTGFGDPCLVADSESPRVLLLSCTGNVSFPGGTRKKHLGIARFYSNDYGKTWSKPEEISESIYAQFDKSAIGSAKSMFIGSGRIFQSSTIKTGSHHRLYCSVLYKDVYDVNKNYVLYSDDFGESWKVLGGVDVAPIPSGADEPKAEELPDGSILCSSRVAGGRYFNIFTFTDSEKAEGSWGTMAFSGADNKGVTALGNSCNGEVMVLPAVRRADKKEVFLILQSVPFGSGRTNVGIYYKELGGYDKFATPDSLAANWDGRRQVSYIASAYSTMTLQSDNTIGFLYEDDTFSDGAGYTIAYKNYSLEQITDSLYAYKEGVDRNAVVKEGIGRKLLTPGKNVGCPNEAGTEKVKAAVEAYLAAPSRKAYEAINKALVETMADPAARVAVSPSNYYRLRNVDRAGGTLYLTVSGTQLTAATLKEDDKGQLFGFLPTGTEGQWHIKSENGYYIGKTGGKETRITISKNETSAAPYKVDSNLDGQSSLSCQTATVKSLPAIHLAGDNTRLVPWLATGSPASLWYIEPTDIATAIAAVERDSRAKEAVCYDLSGRKLPAAPAQGVYITSDRKKRIAK